MGFSGVIGPPSLSKAPTTADQNAVRPVDINTPGFSVVGVNGFQAAGFDSYVEGESFARSRLLPSGLIGGSGAAAPAVQLSYANAPSGAIAGAAGAWAHKGVRLADLGWRNVKHYGAVGDGTTDDKLAIQGALSAGSGVVYFPPGTYAISDTLFWPTGVKLVGAGMYRSIIFALNSFTTAAHSMLVNTNNSTWVGSTGISGGGIEDLGFDGNYAGRGGKEAIANAHCIFLRGGNTSPCTDLYFRRMLVKNSVTMALALQNVERTEVSGCHITDCGRDGVSYWGNTIGTRTVGNLIESCGDDGIAFNAEIFDASNNNVQAEARDNTVANNVVGPGLAPGGAGIALSGVRRTAVTGNTVLSYAVGIRQIMVKTTPATTADFNTIVGNTVMFCGGSAAQAAVLKPSNGVGILIATGDVFTFGGNGSHATSTGCVVANNVVWGSRNIGIWVCQSVNGGAITDTIIQGNYVRGSGGSPIADACGILVGGATGTQFNSTNNFVAAASTTDIQILGNTVLEHSRYGIRCHGIGAPTIADNLVYNSGRTTSAPGISLASCTDSKVTDNRSANRSGTGQSHGIQFTSEAGATMCTNNMVFGNTTTGIANTTPVGTVSIWENIGSAITANIPT